MNRQARLPEPTAGTEVLSIDPLIIHDHYEIDYQHSYAQDSAWFVGLSQGKLLGSRCPSCAYTFATPRGHCMQCGRRTDWVELPLEGAVHTWTTCYFGGEIFLKETPFNLILVRFEGVDTLLLARLIGVEREEIEIEMPVRARFRRRPQFKATDVYFVPR